MVSASLPRKYAALHNAYLDARTTAFPGPIDPHALGAVYHELYSFRKSHLAIAFRIVQDSEDAADVVSNMYVRVPQLIAAPTEFDTFAAVTNLKVRCLALDLARHESHSVRTFVDDVVPPPSRIEDIVQRLTSTLQDIPGGAELLAYGLGYSTEDVAAATGNTEGQVRGLRTRARKKLLELGHSRDSIWYYGQSNS